MELYEKMKKEGLIKTKSADDFMVDLTFKPAPAKPVPDFAQL